MRTHKKILSYLFIAGITLSLGIGLARAGETQSNKAGKPAPATQQQGGLLPGETREQKRERLVKGIEKQVGPLSADQKTHILAILAAAGDEMGAARGNPSLTAEQQNEVVRRVHADVFNRISPALTPEQRSKLQARRSGGDFAGRSNETPQERRARTLKRYQDALPDLSTEQKSKIEAVLDESSAQIKAARENDALSEDARRQAIRKAHTDNATKIDAILTPSQRVKWAAAVAARRQAFARNQGGALPGESREEKRARLLKNYEAVITDLTIDQKTKILAIMEAAGDEMRAADGNTTLTEAQKKEEIRRVHNSVGSRIEAVLTTAQLARWQKAQKSRAASSKNAENDTVKG